MPDYIESLDISTKTPLTFNPSSNDVYILCVIDNNWLIHESPGLNPDWLDEIRLLQEKKIKHFIKN